MHVRTINFIETLLASLVSLVVLSSCEKEVALDLDQMPSRVVIEGQVTNQAGYQFVKLSRTGNFYSSGETPRITNAVVSVTDGDGNEIDFAHNPNNHPDSMGFYLPSSTFVGVIGKDYHLSVEVDGQTFEASDRMSAVTSIDSLKYRINQDEKRDPKIKNRFYELLMYAKEPQQTQDFYLFKFFRNDTLIVYNPSDIYFTDDKTLGEKINGIPSPVYYQLGDSARLEMYSISRTGYVFYNDLFNILNSDGGMFSPPPANARTNISNGALGFFQVSAINISGIRIEE